MKKQFCNGYMIELYIRGLKGKNKKEKNNDKKS